MNGDGAVDLEDHRTWVKDLRQTYFGDANLDGEFNSDDFVMVFAAGKYEKGSRDSWGKLFGELAGWAEGDWNGDGIFNSDDFVTAFQDGGYEQGSRLSEAVPEPTSGMLAALALGLLTAFRIRRWRR